MSVRKKLFMVLCILGVGAVGIVAAQTWGQNPSYFLEALIRWDLQIRPQNTTGPTPFQLYNPSGTLVDSIDASGNMTAHTLTTPSLTVGSGPAMTQAPAMMWGGFYPGTVGQAGVSSTVFPHAVAITRIHATLFTAPVGCSSQFQVAVNDTTTSTFPISGTVISLANGVSEDDSGLISVPITPGDLIQIGTYNGSGCSTNPQNLNVTVQYQMN